MAQGPGQFRPFNWSKRKSEAALLLAEDESTQSAIAARVGCGLSTLKEWMQHPDFQQRVNELRGELEASAMHPIFAKKRRRVRELSGLLEKLYRVIEERATDPSIEFAVSEGARDALIAAHAGAAFSPDLRAVVPGIETGLIVKKIVAVKKISDDGQVKGVQLIEEYAVDTALIGRILDTDELIAKELGQLVDKKELSGTLGQGAEQVLFYLPEKGSNPSPIAPEKAKKGTE